MGKREISSEKGPPARQNLLSLAVCREGAKRKFRDLSPPGGGGGGEKNSFLTDCRMGKEGGTQIAGLPSKSEG